MKTLRQLSLAAVLGLLVSTALAQPRPAPLPDSPATGPAQLIGRGNAAGAQQRVDRAREAADGAPTLAPAAPPADQLLQQRARQVLRTPDIATSTVDATLAAGTIRVEVVSPDGAPVAGAPVRIGVMAEGDHGAPMTGETNAQGVFQQTGVSTGSSQAYRVTVPIDGATYGPVPFRLDPGRGQRIRVRRMPTTQDASALIVVMGQTILELREERLHVVQQAQISNMGADTYVFPEGGLPVALPPGFTAFQSNPVMTDQRVIPNDDGLTLQGSIPTGSVELAWAYDLPISGQSMNLRVALPFRAMRYRVISAAAPGLRLLATGFPAAQPTDSQGESFLLTELSRSPADQPLQSFAITLSGIPGPGPQRMVALGAAGVLLFIALLLILKPGDQRQAEAAVLDARRVEIVAEVQDLERARAASEVGPKYHERRLRELTLELARVLQMQERVSAAEAPSKGPTRSKSKAA